MKKFIASLLLTISPALALGAGGGGNYDHVEIDVQDRESVLRGAKLFVNYCLSCHSAQAMRYKRIGDDMGLTDEQVTDNLIFTGVKVGEPMLSAMTPADGEAYFGNAPPDLSVIARSRGTDWLYTYLRTFYQDDSRPFGVNNVVLAGASMPHVLADYQGLMKAKDASKVPTGYADLEQATEGSMSAAEYDALVKDLVTYLKYQGEPAQLKRAALGPWVLGFLVIFTILAYLTKKEFWKDVH